MIALGLVQNIALLVTLTVTQQLVLRLRDRTSIGYSVLSGSLFGAVAIAGMLMAVEVAPGIVFDGRSIVIAVGGFFGGPVVAAISAAMAIAYRIHLAGAGTAVGVAVIAAAAVLGVVFHYLRRKYTALSRPLALWLFGLLVHLVMLALMVALPAGAWREVVPQIALPVLILYPVATLLVARFILDGEERLGAERARRRSEERLRAIVDQTNQGISLGKPDGTISIYNPAMERLSGFTRQEVEEHGWFESVYPDPERRAEAIQLATEAIEGGHPYLEMPIVRKDGEERWISFATTPVSVDGEDHNLSILTDITEQRHAEERMRELESIVSRSPATAFAWEDTDGWPIRFVSESIRNYGYDPDSLMRDRALFADMMHPEDTNRVAERIERSRLEGYAEFDEEYRLLTRGGEIRWVAEHAWIQPAPDGEPGLLQGVLIDVHLRKTAEIELERHRHNLEELVKERTAELERVNRDLELASKAKSQLLANMSHELRTPMNSIIGFSGILAQGLAGPLEPEQQNQVEMINRSGKQLLGLINDILDLAKAEAGVVRINLARFDPCELIREVAAAMEPIASGKDLELRIETPNGCAPIESDPTRVRQIVLNLAGNAVKFTGTGSVTLSYEPAADGGGAFAVADSGPGIPPDRLDSIFEAFAQLDQPLTAKPSGTGLGLTISLEYARLLGGAITVDTAPGEGSTFTLELPDESPRGPRGSNIDNRRGLGED